MAFRYALQAVLRLRRSLEHQEEQRLAALTGIVARLRADLEARQRAQLMERRAELEDPDTIHLGAQLHFRAFRDAAYEQAMKRRAAQLREAEQGRLEQLKIYQDARRKREIFESLRNHQQHLYNLDVARRQQQSNDEAYLLRTLLPPEV